MEKFRNCLSSDEEYPDGLDVLDKFNGFEGRYIETDSDEEQRRPMRMLTEEFEVNEFTSLANDYKIDPGKFIKQIPGNLRNDYKLGAIIRDEEGGRINHAQGKKFGIDRSIKSIKKAHKNEIPPEVELLKEIDHPCANKIVEIYEDHRSIHVVRSPVKGRLLADVISEIKDLSERESAYILIQILSLSKYLHERNIVLRGLRADNVRVRNRIIGNNNFHTVRVVDFNTTTKFEPGWQQSIADWTWDPENAQFVPPEVHKKRAHDEKFDEWSCGVLAHLLFTGGCLPFEAKTPEEQVELMKTTEFAWSSRFYFISADAQDLISKLLTSDPNERISAEDAMRHPLFDILTVNRQKLLSERVLDILMNRTETKFHQIVMYFFALKWLNEEVVQEEYETFFALDWDKDGFLSLPDLVTALKGKYKSMEIIEALVDRHLQSKLYITFLEFLTYTLDKEVLLYNMEMLQEVFNFFDHNRDDKIDGEELKAQFKDDLVSDDVWTELLMKSLGKPSCNFEDFVEMIRNAY